jgi:ADP-ribosylation factor-binding protein GGA
MFDFANPKPPAAAPAPAADDDDWAFSSALPETLPSSNILSVSETQLVISIHVTREATNPSVITMSLNFSSNADQPISELEFMAAVTKVRFNSIMLGRVY